MIREGLRKRFMTKEFKTRDDLKYSTLARVKAVHTLDYRMLDEIDTRKVDAAYIQGVALSDSSIEEEQRVNDLVKELEKEAKGQICSETSGIDSADDVDSHKSIQNFWVEIEKTKKNRDFSKAYRTKL